MTTTNTSALLGTLLNNIQEIALLAASEQDIVAPLVHNYFAGSDTMAPRTVAAYTGGTMGTIGETTDLTPQTLSPAASKTFYPAIYAASYILTDARIASDPYGAAADAGKDLGRLASVGIDTNLIGLFNPSSTFTAGTIGTQAAALTWPLIAKASALLRQKFAPGPYNAVLTPAQWYDLTAATSGVPTLFQAQELMNQMGAAFYQASWAGINFYVDANAPGTAGTCFSGIFSMDAIGLDIRRGLRIEAQRDASLGGGAIELNASIVYAYGAMRPTFGCGLIGATF
jgi:hypothetical protein